MSSGPLRVAVVGAGISDKPGEHDRFAVVAHLPALKALPKQFQVVATCTTRLATAKAAAEKFGIPHYFDSVEKMLASEPVIDVVCAAVRPTAQFQVVMAALKARKHVYCEHPQGTSTSEATAMYELSREKGVRTVVGHQQHYEPGILQLAHMVRQGEIGDVLSFNIGWVSDGSMVPRDREWLGSGAIRPTWRLGHALERVISVFGPVDSVCADLSRCFMADRVDNMNLLLRMKSGVPGTMHVSQLGWFKLGWSLTIYGSKGMLMLRSVSAKNLRHVVLEGGTREFFEEGRPALKTIVPDTKFRFVDSVDETSSRFSVAQTWHAFGEAIRNGVECSPSFADEARMHRVRDAIEASADQRKWVDVVEMV